MPDLRVLRWRAGNQLSRSYLAFAGRKLTSSATPSAGGLRLCNPLEPQLRIESSEPVLGVRGGARHRVALGSHSGDAQGAVGPLRQVGPAGTVVVGHLVGVEDLSVGGPPWATLR
jgi:hypothetical protein